MNDYTEQHKLAFRTAFNVLNTLWPPENNAEYWQKATAVCTTAWHDTLDGNPLGKALVEAVFDYLAERTKEFATGGETECRNSEEQLSIV